MHEIRHYQPGDIIFTENSPCDGLYVISSGVVSLFKTVETLEGPREIELSQVGPGSIFGEMSIFDQEERSASARAMTMTEISVTSYDDFQEEFAALPLWARLLIRATSRRLRFANERILQQNLLLTRDPTLPCVEHSGIFVLERPETPPPPPSETPKT